MSVESGEPRAWWKEAVIYQIYPRSFADSNGDGIGDLNGITQHLDYLRDLGIDVIWLSPVYQSPNDDNGYDISDYRSIMADFGTMEDFDRMLKRAHELGIRIVMDLVVNHTSDEHAWFVQSRADRTNPYRDYYIWREPKDGKEPNNWGSCFSGSAWKYDETTGMYFLHCFSPKQPDLNWENDAVRREVFDMMTWWCEKGIDGFRMDVISMISKDRSFPDGEVRDGLYGDYGPYVCSGPRVHEYLREMNEKVLSKYDLLTVGEASGVGLEEAVSYAGYDRNELGMIFQFEHVYTVPSKYGKWTTKKPSMPPIRAVLNRWSLGLEKKAWNSLFWCNHDLPRCVSRMGNDSPRWWDRSAKMLATCLHMMKGSVYIYQGEELGMTNAYFEELEDYRDIESVNAYHEYVDSGILTHEEMMECLKEISRDNARTPMQWSDEVQAGFTTGTPWIRVNPNYTRINAAAQMEDPDSVRSYYQRLIRLRKQYDIIVYGTYEPLMEEDEQIFAYQRRLGRQTLICAANWTDRPAACTLFDLEEGRELIGNYDRHEKGILLPYEARVILVEE